MPPIEWPSSRNRSSAQRVGHGEDVGRAAVEGVGRRCHRARRCRRGPAGRRAPPSPGARGRRRGRRSPPSPHRIRARRSAPDRGRGPRPRARRPSSTTTRTAPPQRFPGRRAAPGVHLLVIYGDGGSGAGPGTPSLARADSGLRLLVSAGPLRGPAHQDPPRRLRPARITRAGPGRSSPPASC